VNLFLAACAEAPGLDLAHNERVSNHDFDYARSTNGGVMWQRGDGSVYTLPISQNAESGDPNTLRERIIAIPENSSLINQARMCLMRRRMEGHYGDFGGWW
jgi:hypothetical protein